MKKQLYQLLFSLVVAIGLGVGAASDAVPEGSGRLVHALLYSATILAAMVVFAFVLPRRMGIPMQILVAMVLGIAAGWLLAAYGHNAYVSDYLGVFGRLFILLLKVVVTPLIFVSIVCGVAGIGDVRKLGSLGAKTLAYYIGTTGAAVLIGIVCVNLIQPGHGKEELQREAGVEQAQEVEANAEMTVGQRIQDTFLPRFIKNPVMAGQNPLAIIFFALLLGAALAALGDQGLPAVEVFKSLDKAFVTLVLWIMALAPLGVFALMAKVVATLGLDYILTLAKYTVTVLAGLGAHFVFLTFVVVTVLGRISPLRFLRGMLPALELSFSTSSSSATLPMTIRCASKRVGADENVCNFMLPIGATINMDGTALYTAVASLFIAQVYGVHLGIQEQLMVFLTAIAVSVGTAGIPSASIALLPIILGSVNVPVEGIAIIIGVDRFLDMCRTVVNITGDSVGTVVISRSEKVMGKGDLKAV